MANLFPDYALDGRDSPSAYRRYDEGRSLNYYAADPDLRSTLDLYLDDATMGWAEERLHALGERCGTEIVRRADDYDRVGHELVRHDRFGRDVPDLYPLLFREALVSAREYEAARASLPDGATDGPRDSRVAAAGDPTSAARVRACSGAGLTAGTGSTTLMPPRRSG